MPTDETKLHDLPGRAGGAGSTAFGKRASIFEPRIQLDLEVRAPGEWRPAPAVKGRRRGYMHNQHAGLSQLLAEQRITQRHEQAAHARLAGGARPPRRRRRWATRRWQLARWPAVATEQPVQRPHNAS